MAHLWAAELDNPGTGTGATHAIASSKKRSADTDMDRPHGPGLYPVLAYRIDHTGLSHMERKNDVLHWKIGVLEER